MRVAVISTSLADGYNDLWEAVRPLVEDLIIIGDRRSLPASALVPDHIRPLKCTDWDRGLIYAHLRGLRRTLSDFQPSLVHVNGELWSVPALQVALGSRSPFVVHGAENVWHHGHPAERLIRRWAIRLVLARSSGYASWNHAGADHIRGLVRTDMPVTNFPAIAPPGAFRSRSWQMPGEAVPSILLVGHLQRQKGFDYVLDALGAMTQATRPHVVICGEGPEHEALQSQASRLGVEVDFQGKIDRNALADLMAKCSVLVQPSVSTPDLVEQYGRSVAEALSVGIPTVVSSSGELPWFVGNDTRWVFKERDSADLRRKLEAVLESPQSLRSTHEEQLGLASEIDPKRSASKVVGFWRTCLPG